MSEWFCVSVGLNQGCVAPPWLFNMYVDDEVQEVIARVLERRLNL